MPEPVEFDINSARVTEFGVGIDDGEDPRFVLVPVDAEVQAVLREMVAATRSAMNQAEKSSTYDPSDKHAAQDNLHLPLADELASRVREIHEAKNLQGEARALDNPKTIFCYFARLSDGKGQHLTAVRRATTFKGVLGSRLLSVVNDALKIVPDKVFKLDNDFDFLIDASGVRILRAAGFEFVGDLRERIMNAAPTNVKAIRADMTFIEFASIEAYALKHPRAARCLSSIRKYATKNISKNKLKTSCKALGIKFTTHNDKMVIGDESIMSFLEFLDRRLYQLELIDGSPEAYRAGSRTKFL